jgi:hypothetical protein
VKKQIRDAHNATFDDVRAETKRFWVQIAKRTKDLEKFNAAIGVWQDQTAEADRRRGVNWDSPSAAHGHGAFVNEVVLSVLFKQAHRGLFRQATMEDLANVGFVPATTRTTSFIIGPASITFAGREVRYGSGEAKSQADQSRSFPQVQALFKALGAVEWTRGTGGEFFGNDEHNVEDGRYAEGSGASYRTEAFGPIGEQREAASHGITVAQLRAQRQRVHRETRSFNLGRGW